MKLATIQRRLKDRLVAAIYGIVEALFPVIQTITTQYDRPWTERVRFESRFSRIIQELLALTARIRPATLSPNPTFPSAPPRRKTDANPDQAPRRQKSRPTRDPLTPAKKLTARQLAECLAKLLREAQKLALEAGAALDAIFYQLATQARKIAGCDALPPRTTAWERAG